ncbi:stimulated by retinoic acid gene 6 protein-like isoform X5 [Myotis lucifugus]|uniref:stimulated by retinoic acid gene 6 protein-like isoform X5 n=1 Tax=Myotis lucifugus TaxID=59463 RepID=UPI000CCC089F|nr:stimulated by retinoic acid gene 6 protein-like isoform X5 [Myotis lucifugus]
MAPVLAWWTWNSFSITPSSHHFSSFWSCPFSKDGSTANREMTLLPSWGTTLELSYLWTSWAPLVTDGPTELPSEPQPIRSCSCSQKAPSSGRSRSGPKVPGPPHSCWEFNHGHSCSQRQHAGVLWGQRFLGRYQTVMFYWPSLLCLSFLLGRFLYMFVKSLRVHLGWELQAEEKPFLEIHQAEHVKQLLRKPPLQERKKSWFQSRIYEWDPCFQFPSRMIGTTVLASICLYLFIVIEFCVFVYVRDKLDVFEGELESYIASVNQTGTLTPVILQAKELMNISKGVWVVTIFPAFLTCVSYLFHILACYRKHVKRLWAGNKHFLPLKFHNPSSSGSVAAIARYSGWQIAYILWGYLSIHVVQSLCGMVIVYSLVLPIIHNQGREMLQGLGIGILTISIVLGLMILQVWIAASFFLQPKMGTADKQKPLALNNRKVFHNFNYFLFFYNVLLGLGACLSRLLISCILGTWLIARIDRTIMQNGYEGADMGFSAWVGMLYVDHYHTNPVLVSFCHNLLTGLRERKLQQAIRCEHLRQSAGPRTSARPRTRWLLLQTLINNPRLVMLRKSKPDHGSQEFTQILLTGSES